MTDKAYIVVNEEQEREVLNDLERQGIEWVSGGEKPTEFTPKPIQFPYGLFTDDEGQLKWGNMRSLEDEEIVFDGRKEEQMSEKYVVSQEFMNELEEWKEAYITDTLDEKYHYVSAGDLDTLPGMIKDWWIELNKPTETNNRLIAIIRWVNGEDVFEVEKSKKWVIRSKEAYVDDDYLYFTLIPAGSINHVVAITDVNNAIRFDTKEEAESWVNAHQEVVEVDD